MTQKVEIFSAQGIDSAGYKIHHLSILGNNSYDLKIINDGIELDNQIFITDVLIFKFFESLSKLGIKVWKSQREINGIYLDNDRFYIGASLIDADIGFERNICFLLPKKIDALLLRKAKLAGFENEDCNLFKKSDFAEEVHRIPYMPLAFSDIEKIMFFLTINNYVTANNPYKHPF